MKVVVITPQGEQGPFTPAQINRMFAEGRINGEQLCRIDDSLEAQPLKERFRHMAPDKAVAAGAKANVEAYVERERSKAAMVAGTLAIAGGVLSFVLGRIIRGVFLTGFGAFALGREYLKKGTPISPPSVAEERPERVAGENKTYDY